MPWWPGAASQGVQANGSVGGTAESREKGTWPNYEAAYLAKRLGAHDTNAKYVYDDRYKGHAYIGDDAAKAVYLDKVTEGYKDEAEACLKAEFDDWLQGKHEANLTGKSLVYENAPGKPKRRAVVHTKESDKAKLPGEELTEWHPTWWGQDHLVNLPGVREHLREDAIARERHEYNMNLLAEFGPQNLDEAWAYFKHWVKGRPVAPEVCVNHRAPKSHTYGPSGGSVGPTGMDLPRGLHLGVIEALGENGRLKRRDLDPPRAVEDRVNTYVDRLEQRVSEAIVNDQIVDLEKDVTYLRDELTNRENMYDRREAEVVSLRNEIGSLEGQFQLNPIDTTWPELVDSAPDENQAEILARLFAEQAEQQLATRATPIRGVSFATPEQTLNGEDTTEATQTFSKLDPFRRSPRGAAIRRRSPRAPSVAEFNNMYGGMIENDMVSPRASPELDEQDENEELLLLEKLLVERQPRAEGAVNPETPTPRGAVNPETPTPWSAGGTDTYGYEPWAATPSRNWRAGRALRT